MNDKNGSSQSELTEAARRLAILRPYLNGELPLAVIAHKACIPLRTAWRWDSMAVAKLIIFATSSRARYRPFLKAI